jgi:hypothetical protein
MGELPAAGDQGLGTWLRQRTDRPHEWHSGLLVGGLDFRYRSRRLRLTSPVNDFTNGRSASQCQALGGSVGLSFMR